MTDSFEKEASGVRDDSQPRTARIADGAGARAGSAVAHLGPSPTGRWAPGRPIPPKVYRISEVAAYAGTTRQTIHNYTTMGLLQECRWTDGGHRLYDESVFQRLDEILSMRARRMSIQDIREHFLGGQERRA